MTVEAMQDYLPLKGEFPIAAVAGHFVTNYRLSMLIDGSRINIPLSNLIKYEQPRGPLELVWMQGGEQQSLEISGTILAPMYVQHGRNAYSLKSSDSNQNLLLSSTRFDLTQGAPGLNLPPFGFPD